MNNLFETGTLRTWNERKRNSLVDKSNFNSSQFTNHKSTLDKYSDTIHNKTSNLKENTMKSESESTSKDLSVITTSLTKDTWIPRSRSSASTSVTSRSRSRSGSRTRTRSIRSEKVEILEFMVSLEKIDGIISTKTSRRSGENNMPVFAVASYNQTIKESEYGSIVKSNIPSMPLAKSTSSCIGNRDRYDASFRYRDNSNRSNVPESIYLTVPMVVDQKSMSGYEARQMDITISIMRGSEVLELGVASLPLEGHQTNVSALLSIIDDKNRKIARVNGRKSVASTPRNTGAIGARSSAFKDDPSQKYSLQRATIRVSIECKKKCADPACKASYKDSRIKVPENPPPLTDLFEWSTSTISGITDSEKLTKGVSSSLFTFNSESSEITNDVYAPISNCGGCVRNYENSPLNQLSFNSSRCESQGIDTIDEISTLGSHNYSKKRVDSFPFDGEGFLSGSDASITFSHGDALTLENSVDGSKKYLGFYPFDDESSVTRGHIGDSFYSNNSDSKDTLSNDESSKLDHVSLSTIRFKQELDEDRKNAESSRAITKDRSRCGKKKQKKRR